MLRVTEPLLFNSSVSAWKAWDGAGFVLMVAVFRPGLDLTSPSTSPGSDPKVGRKLSFFHNTYIHA